MKDSTTRETAVGRLLAARALKNLAQTLVHAIRGQRLGVVGQQRWPATLAARGAGTIGRPIASRFRAYRRIS